MTLLERWEFDFPHADGGALRGLWWLVFVGMWDDVGRYHMALTNNSVSR